MTAITTLRTTIATELVDNSRYSVFAFPPASPIVNSVVVMPDDPYITPSNNLRASVAPQANFKIVIFLPLIDNEGNLNGLEDTVVAVYNKLAASPLHFTIGAVSAPSTLSTQSTDLLTCEIAVSTLTEWS